VADGQLFRGATGTSAEFGHQVVLPLGGPPCDCGSTGCLEALASGRGIAARARQAYGMEAPDPPLTAEAVAEAARRGDPIALRVWEETALYLGLGIANVINLLDPEVVVIGGGVAAGAGDLLFEEVREVVARRCMPSLARRVPILPAALGPDVGLVGAACLAMERDEMR
jgi:glucokinase